MKSNSKMLSIVLGVILILLVTVLIYKQVHEHYMQDDPKLKELLDIVSPMFNQEKYWVGNLSILNDRDVIDEITLYRGNKSYTINKEKVFLCLKDEKGQYYPLNTLIFVFLHELSHVLCESIGHTEEFHQIFDQLLEEAMRLGIYNPSIPIIRNYCQDGDPEV